MLKLVATVKDKSTKEVLIIRREYSSKEEFKNDLRGNGYVVLRNRVYTESEYDNRMSEVM